MAQSLSYSIPCCTWEKNNVEFVLFDTECVQVKRQQKNRICMYTKVNDGFQSVSKLSKVKDGER